MPFYIHIADCNVQCSLWMLTYYITCRTVCAHSPWSPWAPWCCPAAPGPSPWRAPSCGRSTPPSLRGVPGILVTSLNLSSPCYSPHLQSMRCGIPLSIIFYKKLMITCIIKAKVWLTEFCVLCVYKIFSQQPVNILLKSQKKTRVKYDIN